MARAVLDSSALVSAFLTPRGTCSQLLRAARRGAFVCCLSREILAETVGTLLEKRERLARTYGYDEQRVARYARDLLATSEQVGELPNIKAVPLDPKDNMIVATAVAAKAEYLVTGDRKHLLSLGEYQGIRIVTPRAFLDLLAAERP
jgi:putative PIN family toxin of toxin-antitoxin system